MTKKITIYTLIIICIIICIIKCYRVEVKLISKRYNNDGVCTEYYIVKYLLKDSSELSQCLIDYNTNVNPIDTNANRYFLKPHKTHIIFNDDPIDYEKDGIYNLDINDIILYVCKYSDMENKDSTFYNFFQ